MKFIHRLGYYLGGFSIGLIILAFILGGKKTSCDYSPDARVLKNIRNKEHVYSPNAEKALNLFDLDTTHISEILENGDVDFSRSNTDIETCKIYLVTGKLNEKNLELLIENCDSLATFQEIKLRD